jgi:hypothetical protein
MPGVSVFGRQRWRAKPDGPFNSIAHSYRPLLRLPFLGDVQQDPGMGIGPLEFLDGAFQVGRLLGIEHREGMVGRGGNSVHRNDDARECCEFHWASSLQYFMACRRSKAGPERSGRIFQVQRIQRHDAD